MNEMDLLEEFRASVASPSPGTLTAARARVLHAGTGTPGRGTPGPSRRPARRWLIPLGAVAAAGAVAASATLAASGGGRPRPAPARLTAAVVLQRAARAALAAPAPGSNPYLYAVTVGGSGRRLNSVTKQWVSIDGRRRSAGWTNNCAVKGDPACLFWLEPIPATSGFFSYTGVQKLPTAAAPLLRYLAGEQARACRVAGLRMTAAGYEWSGIYTILTDIPVLPPRFGAALFRAAAQIPGVTVIRNARTSTGQRGIAVTRTVHPAESQNYPYAEQAELIFSSHSYRYIGSIVRSRANSVPWSSTLVAAKFVKSAPHTSSAFVMPLNECIGL